ncbi:MAG: hypothetical protein R3B07_32145 [Polyangiaceae bacterium]
MTTINEVAQGFFRELEREWNKDGQRAISKLIEFHPTAEEYDVTVDDVEAALWLLHQAGYIHWPKIRGALSPTSTQLTPLGEDVCRGRASLRL